MRFMVIVKATVAELRRAAGLAQNERERALLVQRARDWG